MEQSGVRQRSIALIIPGQTVDKAAEALLGDYKPTKVTDPIPTTKGSGASMQFGEWWQCFLLAPYHVKGRFRWYSYLITLFLTFMLATVMGTVVTNVASYATSTSVALNAYPVAIVTFFMLLIGMSFRAADHLPQYMAPYLVFVECFHGKIGVIVALPMIAMMLVGGALSAPILNGIQGTNLPNYAAAVRPLSYWGAVALQTSVVAFVVYVFQQNTRVKQYHLWQAR